MNPQPFLSRAYPEAREPRFVLELRRFGRELELLAMVAGARFFTPPPLLVFFPLFLFFSFSFSFSSSSPSFLLFLLPRAAATRCNSTSFFVVICCLLLQLQQTRQPRRRAPLPHLFLLPRYSRNYSANNKIN